MLGTSAENRSLDCLEILCEGCVNRIFGPISVVMGSTVCPDISVTTVGLISSIEERIV